jgi:hypothetical protein
MRKKPPAGYNLPPEASYRHLLETPFHNLPPDGLSKEIILKERKKTEFTKGPSFGSSAIFFSEGDLQPLSAPFSRRVELFRVSLSLIVYRLIQLSSTKTWSSMK